MLKIKKYRIEKNMTQIDLANRLCVQQSTVSQWEKGRITPPLDKLIAMSDLFGCTIDELVR